ncbi:hypothetical protein EAF00_002605 [Botryotinia globosa]|nr:hypothetical protein EAF00_002605 [Botryotinia globosa]
MHSKLKVVLQDLPEVVEGIEKTLPDNMKDRIGIIAHDIFSDQCSSHLLRPSSPEPGTTPLLREQAARGMEMIMLSLFNSRERDADGWAALF